MVDRREEMLDILKHNLGFDNPEDWIEYAEANQFRKFKAEYKRQCPDCGQEDYTIIGQYVYYAQLIRVNKCNQCSLIWSDVTLDRSVTKEHFEEAYKDDHYFSVMRRPIMRHIAKMVARLCSNGSTVLDVGGATGYMVASLEETNCRFETVVNDISEEACRQARERFGVETICCLISDLDRQERQFGVVLVIDALYYVVNINKAWESLSSCLKNEGTMILRLPNKMWWIEILQRLQWAIHDNPMADRLFGVNPEHVLFFKRPYLRRKLRQLGFGRIEFRPSPPLRSDNSVKRLVSAFVHGLSVAVYYVSLGTVCLSPSQLVIAHKLR